MIDFNSLKLTVDENYSFVGIKKQNNILVFYLPKGFDKSVSGFNTFCEKRDLFFLFYRILNTFKDICFEKGCLEKPDRVRIQDRDGVINQSRGSKIQWGDEETANILYSKLDMIGHLLNAYDEPKILSLAYRLGRSDKFDVSKIHRYLHQAVYLKNNAAYIEEALLPRKTIQFEATDIVAMYCYLYCETKQQLEEEVNAEILALAERFRQHYLRVQDSIFDEQSYEQVIDTLKDTLDRIDSSTPLKDADYWQYYEVIELFIYGDWHQAEEGEIWGIKNFYAVWESMCLTYLVDITDSCRLLQIDNTYLKPKTIEKIESSIKTFEISNVFRLNGVNLTPDAVVMTAISDQLKDSRNYEIRFNNWNDYGYCTYFVDDNDRGLHIAYPGQDKGVHTIDSLSEYYKGNKNLIIDSRLPSKYYSYWRIEDLDFASLQRMYYFNHFFYLALEKGIRSWQGFKDHIAKPLNIKFDSKNNVFSTSLFREYVETTVQLDFEVFVEVVSRLLTKVIEIVDVKYLSQDYFRDKSRIEEIKKRSVRKQFVYEYLLQKDLEHKKNDHGELNINSSFWIPDNRLDDPDIIKAVPTFLDGFIKLQSINFLALAKNYLS